MTLASLLLLPMLLLSPGRLQPYVDHNRVILIFAPTAADPRLRDQTRILNEHQQELKDRDLIVLTNVLHRDPAGERTLYRIPPNDFTVILIGKDGGEKLRLHIPITIEKLTQTVDAMPMRQNEMRNRRQ